MFRVFKETHIRVRVSSQIGFGFQRQVFQRAY
jgi:hypothetical protein